MMDVYIYAGARSPRGAASDKGSLHDVKPVELLSQLYHSVLTEESKERIDDIRLGCNTAVRDQGANIAKTSALYAGLPSHIPGATVNRFCASGLDAINSSAATIAAGMASLSLAGGVECMSRVDMFADKGAWFADPEVATRTGFVPMGAAADGVANVYGFDRTQLDEWALRSHQKAATAADNGWFGSIAPIQTPAGEVSADQTIRSSLTIEKLASLNPLFGEPKPQYQPEVVQEYPELAAVAPLHTVATSPAMVDGASVLLLGSRQAGQELGLTPIARIASFANVSVNPQLMLTGTAPATTQALELAGMKVGDVDLFECNESFAATTLAYLADLDVDPELVNVNGGAIAMGHPLGATGAILLTTLLDELQRRQKNVGVATIPAGGGLATATVIEVLNETER